MNLSIIIPVYNAEKYLDDCLKSVFETENNDIEVILIDDGSTDGSEKIYTRYANQRLKYIKNKNHGVSYSRNVGISKSKGKWIMFLDADDILKTGWQNSVSAFFESDFDIVFFSNQNNFSNLDRRCVLECILGVDNKYKFMSFPCSRIFKKDFIEKNKIQFDTDIINGEDLLFNIAAVLKTEKIHYENKGIYYYRNNIYSVTQNFNKKIFFSDQKFHKKLKKILSLGNEKQEQQYLDCLKENAMYLFANKIAMISDKKQRKEYYTIFNEEEYNRLLNNNNKIFNFKELILYLIFKNKIDFAIFLIRTKEKVKKIIKLRGRKDILELV